MIFLIFIALLILYVGFIKLSVIAKKNKTVNSFEKLDKLLQKRYKILQVMLNLVRTTLTNEKQKAEYSGKLLSIILLSKKFFGDLKINLVGFSLGCHVIKYCLKEIMII